MVLDLYRAYLSALVKQDVMKVFQVVKYLQDRLTTTRERKGGMAVVNTGTRDVLVCEMYTMACLQLLVYGQGLRLQGNRLGFTAEEQAYFLKPLHDPDYEYFSNIERRFGAQLTRDKPELWGMFDLTSSREESDECHGHDRPGAGPPRPGERLHA